MLHNDRRMFNALLRRELSFFLRTSFREIGGEREYLHAWYIDAMIHVLDLVHRGLIRRLIITLPPRHLKSVLVSTCWPAWLLGNDPAHRVLVTSYGQDLADKFARDGLRIMDAPWYRSAFPNLQLNKRSVDDFETTMGGGRLSTSLNGPITGRGADTIIIDDPIKAADLMFEATRTKSINWLRTVVMNRLENQETGAIVLVMQRLHQADLAGELIEQGGWYELRLPAIATEDALIPIGGGRVYSRREGDVLNPLRQSQATLEALRREIGSANFSAQYQQDPVPAEGNMIHASWLRVYDLLPLKIGRARVVQSYDTASKEGVNCDWSVCITALVIGPMVYVINVWRKKVEFPELLQSTINRAQAFQADVLLVEDQASGTQLIQSLRSKQVRGVPLPIARKPDTDKRSRVAGVSAMMEAGQLLLPAEAPWLADFKSELLAFDNGKHDDQVDALSQLLTWVRDQERWGPPPRIGAPIYG